MPEAAIYIATRAKFVKTPRIIHVSCFSLNKFNFLAFPGRGDDEKDRARWRICFCGISGETEIT